MRLLLTTFLPGVCLNLACTLLGPVCMQSASGSHPPLLPSRQGLMASETQAPINILQNQSFISHHLLINQ